MSEEIFVAAMRAHAEVMASAIMCAGLRSETERVAAAKSALKFAEGCFKEPERLAVLNAGG